MAVAAETYRNDGAHPAVYIVNWIFFSSTVIIFNKWILDDGGFPYPIILTTWHMVFATGATQILAETTSVLDSRKNVNLTGGTYLRAIVPIGIFYSMSLVFSNLTYMYLSVAFIQMLKAAGPSVILVTSWTLGAAKPNSKVFINVLVIVFGVALASLGEIRFSVVGFMYQFGGLVSEAIRLVMVQILLSGKESDQNDKQVHVEAKMQNTVDEAQLEEGKPRTVVQEQKSTTSLAKMDPLVSLYYYAPVCAVMNFIVALIFELPSFELRRLYAVGPYVLIANAALAFFLNAASVFLIGKTSSLVLTLSGVLKNILIILISVVIWGTAISWLQIVGYSIALVALTYYSIGWEGFMAILPTGCLGLLSNLPRFRVRPLVLATGLSCVVLLTLWLDDRRYKQMEQES